MSPLKIWIAVIGSTLGAFMAVLNIQIVNASLADIQGAIGAGTDDGGWISTSYLIAEIVVIPLTGWLARVFSVRNYLLVNAILFLVFSVACAFAANLQQMIILRAIQGFSGGVLIPMAFTIIITMLPKAKQPIGLALFALSATFAPAIGPTIGGYLTENWGWEYIFYVNLVPGALMVAMLWASLDRAPMNLGLLAKGDWPGIVTMAIGLAALQTVLEEGNKDDWFGSPFIVRLSVIAAVSLTLFLIIELTRRPSAPEPAPAGAPQLRLRHRRQLPARHRALWLGLHPADLSDPHPGLQFRADRHGAGLDRHPAAAADPAGAAPDEAYRRAHADRRRLCPLRRLELHEHPHDRRTMPATSCSGRTSCAPSARPWSSRRCRPSPPRASSRRMPVPPRRSST